MSNRLVEFLQKVGSKEVAQGEELFRDGDTPDDSMYFIFSGEVGIFKKRPDGEKRINTLGAGSFFGEMALVNSRPRLATARVLTSTARVAVINKEMLLKLAGSSPQFLFNLLKYSVSRLLAAKDKLQRVREELQVEKRNRGVV